jgi:DNA-binding winged helix-turn-helix (wHTH) protein
MRSANLHAVLTFASLFTQARNADDTIGFVRFRFGRFTLDLDQRQLFRGDETVKISPKAFSLFEVMARRGPGALSKNEIHRLLWPGEFVEDGSLHNLVSEIRRALGEDRVLLRTVPRYGYALSIEPDRTSTAMSRFCLVVGDARIPLRLGDSILGRGPDTDVPVELPGVSRHHARITTTATDARIEDLGSKNGTFVGQRRVESPAPLHDGDEFFLGRAMLSFHIDRRRLTTRTEPS